MFPPLGNQPPHACGFSNRSLLMNGILHFLRILYPNHKQNINCVCFFPVCHNFTHFPHVRAVPGVGKREFCAHGARICAIIKYHLY